MGKFENRKKMPGPESCENICHSELTGRAIIKNKKFPKYLPYFSDPLLLPRINQYLAENKDKIYIDINNMVKDLQSRYREYGRRKKNVFRQSVQKAFTAVLQQYGLNQANQDDEYVGSTDNSSSEIEECNFSDNEEKNNASNRQLINLYKPPQHQTLSKHFAKSPNENAEVINLISDDENTKKKEFGNENIFNDKSNNGIQNHINAQEISHPETFNKSDKLERVAIMSRKRKSHSDKISFHKSERRQTLLQSKVTFSDFGGNTKALEEVCKLILHIQHPELYRRIGLSSPRGFLLHGPPGCGKTLLANAIAGELKVHFLKISAPELVTGVSGESEKRIRELFDTAVKFAPCVLFIDEVDAITPNRQNAQKEMERRIVAQLLTCLDDLGNDSNGDQVLVIGATNRPDTLDPALRRAGRFDREVCLGIPDFKAREQILRVLCKNLKLSSNFSYEEVAENTPGFVGADLLALTREAAMAAINRVFHKLHSQLKHKSRYKKIKLDLLKGGGRIKNETVKCIVSKRQSKRESDSEVSIESEIETLPGNLDSTDLLPSDFEDLPSLDKKSGNFECEDKIETDIDDIVMDEVDKKCNEEENSRDICHMNQNTNENDQKINKDIPETTAEESVNYEVDDIEVCKDENVKRIGSETEAEIEILPENYDPGPPSLDTLLLWLRSTPLSPTQLESIYLTQEDFRIALRYVQPSAKREGFATVPDVTWDDIGSLVHIREELKMLILGPVKLRKQFDLLGLTAPAGILICGPPGCGKTLLAKAVANEAGINFISVKGPELLNMYVGESERAVRQCFQRARNSAPCVIFFDELDALCPQRKSHGENASMRVVNQMLTEMDGVEDRKQVYIMAATNRPDIVDPAVLRPGRLDKILFVDLPEANDRSEILMALTKKGTRPKLASDVNLSIIAQRPECDGYSGADLAALVREAGVQALKDLIAKSDFESESDVLVTAMHFERALKIVRPSVSQQIKKKEFLAPQFCGQEVPSKYRVYYENSSLFIIHT